MRGMTADRARGALLGTFVGDALGMPFEGAPAAALPERVEMVEARLGRGTYTDDTQMAIALAESLLECGGVDERHLGRALAAAYDPRRGYGAGTTAVLREVRSGVSAITAAARLFRGEGNLGNGAAMRVAPVAVLFAPERERVPMEAERTARVTHAHLFGVDAARVQAAAVAAALRDDDVVRTAHAAAHTAELRHRLDRVSWLLGVDASPAREPHDARRATPPADVATQLGNSTAGHESVPAAIYAATAHDDFESAVSFAVRCGGDTDTIGAMAGAIAGARHGASAIPRRWLDALEDGEKGRRYVERLADELAAVRSGAATST
jgi:poly(ADP-ribose) glycohydrolase ARH3